MSQSRGPKGRSGGPERNPAAAVAQFACHSADKGATSASNKSKRQNKCHYESMCELETQRHQIRRDLHGILMTLFGWFAVTWTESGDGETEA